MRVRAAPSRLRAAAWRRPPPPPPPPPDAPSTVYRATLAYDGTDFSGWQLQARSTPAATPRTVQGELETALETTVRWPRVCLRVTGAGRTDAGVHARGQVASFRGPAGLPPARLAARLNSVLPPDVRCVGLAPAPRDFSARYSPVGKTYGYTLDVGRDPDPCLRRHAAHAPALGRDDGAAVDAVAAAASLYVGEHDFSAFATVNAAHPRAARVRSVTAAALGPGPHPHTLVFRVTGTGFLYRQVRHMVGALLAVGAGTLAPDAIARRLASPPPPTARGDYRGWTVAPPHGLCLEEVQLPAGVEDTETLLHGGTAWAWEGGRLVKPAGGD